jgi:hypothetical protein
LPLRYYEKELQRIHSKLNQFLSDREAHQAATWIQAVVLEVDEEISRILRDPLVRELYAYDGKFFMPKGADSFHRAFDGFNILQSLTNSAVQTYFYAREKQDAIRWLMDDLDTHRWAARVRRMNWEESGTLCCVRSEVIEEIVRRVTEENVHAEHDHPQLSPEETAFFKSYEDQIA